MRNADKMSIREQLEKASFFRGLSDEHRTELEEISVLKSVAKRDYLFHEGELGCNMFLMLEGSMQLHKNTEEGREVVIRVVQAGDVFGEVVLFEKERYPVSARAVTQVQVLMFSKMGIYRLLNQESFRNDFIAMLMMKQRYLATRIQELTTQDVEQRLFAFLHTQYGEGPNFQVPLSKKDVAAAIGTTPESLSRLLQRLQDEGVLEWKGGKVRMGRG